MSDTLALVKATCSKTLAELRHANIATAQLLSRETSTIATHTAFAWQKECDRVPLSVIR